MTLYNDFFFLHHTDIADCLIIKLTKNWIFFRKGEGEDFSKTSVVQTVLLIMHRHEEYNTLQEVYYWFWVEIIEIALNVLGSYHAKFFIFQFFVKCNSLFN